ncbi:MAG: class I adenylate-forming enzyme family protein [bacterium]
MIHYGDSLRINAAKFPQKICLIDEKRRITFAEFNRRVNKLANALLGQGLKPGDKVAVFSRNSIEYMEIFHACAKAGICLVTLNFWLHPEELVVLFNHSDALFLFLGDSFQETFASIEGRMGNLCDKGVIVMGRSRNSGWRGYEEFLCSGPEEEPAVPVRWEDPYWMLYTSGTTGNPKGVLRSHKRTALCGWYTLLEFNFWRNDCFLAISPFFHGVTFFPLMILQTGGSVFVVSEFQAEKILEIIENEKITASFMVPTMLDMLLNSPRLEKTRFDSLRCLVTGGAPLPTPIKEGVMERIGPVLYEFYGAGESGYLTVLHPQDQLRKIRCCGQPCFGAELEVRDKQGRPLPPGRIGALFSKCAGRFDGYYKNPEKTAEALQGEWFTAGDLGMKDGENYYYIVDRETDMIISGGENIYPREIEDILKSHPAVADCAVFGIPDQRWGEAVKAMIVLKPNQSVSAEEITAYCSKYLAGYKRPKVVSFVEDLPRTSSGKIMKKKVRDEHWTGKEKV